MDQFKLFLSEKNIGWDEFLKLPQNECYSLIVDWQTSITGLDEKTLDEIAGVANFQMGVDLIPGKLDDLKFIDPAHYRPDDLGFSSSDDYYTSWGVDYQEGLEAIGCLFTSEYLNEVLVGDKFIFSEYMDVPPELDELLGWASEDGDPKSIKDINYNNIPEDKKNEVISNGWKFDDEGNLICLPDEMLYSLGFDIATYRSNPSAFDQYMDHDKIFGNGGYSVNSSTHLGFFQGSSRLIFSSDGVGDVMYFYNEKLNTGEDGVTNQLLSEEFDLNDPALKNVYNLLYGGSEFIKHHEDFIAFSFASELNKKYDTSKFVVSFDNYTNNINDFFEQNFYIQHNGHKIKLPDIYAMGENGILPTTKYVEEFTSEDLHDYDSLGFVISSLIDTEMNDSLSGLGYSKITTNSSGKYQITFENGQILTLNSDVLELFYDSKNNKFSIDKLHDTTLETTIYKNNQINSLLNSKYNIEAIDVRFDSVNNEYMIHLNGEIYNVPSDKITFNEDGSIDQSCFNDLLEYLPSADEIQEISTENKYVAGRYFTPCINCSDEKFYKQIASDLRSFVGNGLFSSCKTIFNDVDVKITAEIGAVEKNFDAKLKKIEDQCLNLSLQIDKCVNMLVSCDDDMKAYLDKLIDNFFVATDLETGTINMIDDKDDTVAFKEFFKKEAETAQEAVDVAILSAAGLVLLDESEISKYGLNSSDFETYNVGGQTYYTVSAVYLTEHLKIDGNIYDWYENLNSDAEREKYSSLVSKLQTTSMYLSNNNAVLVMKENAELFKNMTNYLPYCLEDKFYNRLEEIRKDPSNCVDFLSYSEQVLFEFEMNKKYGDIYGPELLGKLDYKYIFDQCLDPLMDSTGEYLADNWEKMLPGGSILSTLDDSVVLDLRAKASSIINEITNNRLNERKGYVDALQYLEHCYKNGQIDVDEGVMYWVDKLDDGLKSIPRGIWHLFNPESTDNEWRDLFIADILSSGNKEKEYAAENPGASYSGYLDEQHKSGQLNSLEFQLRKDVLNYGVNGSKGLNPQHVADTGEYLETTGEIISQFALDILTSGSSELFKIASHPVTTKTLGNLVKCLSKGGWKANTLYESQDYGALEASLYGWAYGLVTFSGKELFNDLNNRYFSESVVDLGGVNTGNIIKKFVSNSSVPGAVPGFSISPFWNGVCNAGGTAFNKIMTEQLFNVEDFTVNSMLALIQLTGVDYGIGSPADLGFANLWNLEGGDWMKIFGDTLKDGLTS